MNDYMSGASSNPWVGAEVLCTAILCAGPQVNNLEAHYTSSLEDLRTV